MDELDVRILRALMAERAVAPSDTQVNSSLRSIATRLGADDMTVNYRYKKLQESGVLSGWHLMINPTFFGCRMMEVTVDVEPESAKQDMIRKLKLVHEIVGFVDFYGKALKMMVVYNSEDSCSRTIELISRITGAERIIQIRTPLPQSRAERLTETDASIIRVLSKDARKSFIKVSKELDLSTSTVRNHVARLKKYNTIAPFPILNLGGVKGIIPVYLSYSYSQDGKASADRAMLSQFEASYFWGQFSDSSNGYIFFSASIMTDVRDQLEWAKVQPGIASARVDIVVKTMMLPEKLNELLEVGTEAVTVQKKAFL